MQILDSLIFISSKTPPSLLTSNPQLTVFHDFPPSKVLLKIYYKLELLPLSIVIVIEK